MIGAFTMPVEDGMRFRHDAELRFTVTAGREVLEDRLTPAETIGGAMTVAAITYNARSVSGGVSWWNPATGKPISRPKVQIRTRPEDVLTGETLCDCTRCQ